MERKRCLVVDDEKSSIELLKHYIGRRADLQLIHATQNPLEVANMVKEHDIQLLFADLHMEQMHGIQLIGQVIECCEVICCTAYNYYGPTLSELDVAYYLLKPYSYEKFNKAVDRTLLRMTKNGKAEPDGHGQAPTDLNDRVSLQLKGKNKILFLELIDIEYLVAEGEFTKVHHTNGIDEVAYGIGQLIKLLPADLFMRIHKGFVVSVSRISTYCSTGGIRLKGKTAEECLSVGRTYAPAVRELMQRKLLKEKERS